MQAPRILATLPLLAALACFAPDMGDEASAEASTGSDSSAGPSSGGPTSSTSGSASTSTSGSASTSTSDPSATEGTTSPTSAEGSTSGDESSGSETAATTDCGDAPMWHRDADRDGYGDPDDALAACDAPDGYVEDASDCNDDDPAVHPGAEEVCGAPDLDCDEMAAPLCASCRELLDTGASADDTYTIDPDGDGELDEEEVWCDMTTDGGGWTLVQRTLWSATQTDALVTGHDAFMHATVGDAEPGFAYRLRGEAWPAIAVEAEHLLRIDLRVASNGGSCDPLRYVGTGGEITLTEDGLTIDDLDADVPLFSGTDLTTADSGPSTQCIDDWDAVPWFYADCCYTCPAFGGDYWPERHPMIADYVDTTADLDGNIGADVCPSPAIDSALPGTHYGANLVEFYVR